MIISILTMLFLIILSAIFAASEVALIVISDNKVDDDAEKGNKKAIRIQKYTKSPKVYVATLQMLITLIAIINGAIALSTFKSEVVAWFDTSFALIEPVVIAVIAVLLLVFHVVFAQLIPRRLANKYPNQIAYASINLVTFMSKLMFPMVWILIQLSSIIGRLFGLDPNEGERKMTEEEILEAANKLGVTLPEVDPGLTVAIGSIDVSLYEMVRAWIVMIGGRIVEPYAVEEILDAKGKSIEAAELKETEIILAPDISFAITRGLRATVELPHGTGNRANEELVKKLGVHVMGKTGTATDAEGETTDNWFVGCTPSYCMGIWIGRDKKLPMKTTVVDGQPIQETGGRNALPVFIKTMQKIYETEPKDIFSEATDPKKPFKLKPKEGVATIQNEENSVAEGDDF